MNTEILVIVYLAIGTLLAISFIVTKGWNDMKILFPVSIVLFWLPYAIIGFIMQIVIRDK